MLDSLQGGEQESAWKWFVERYRPYVHGVLVATLQSTKHAVAAEGEFWGYLYLSDAVQRADRGRRFRTYLTGIVRNFARQWRRSHAEPDGSPLPPQTVEMPDTLVEAEIRGWTQNVLSLCLRTLRDEMPKAAHAVCGFYGVSSSSADTAGAEAPALRTASELMAELQCSQPAFYNLLSRGRHRLGELIRQELLEGCADSAEVEHELSEVLRRLGQMHPGIIESAEG
jgi:hypothetical protein